MFSSVVYFLAGVAFGTALGILISWLKDVQAGGGK